VKELAYLLEPKPLFTFEAVFVLTITLPSLAVISSKVLANYIIKAAIPILNCTTNTLSDFPSANANVMTDMELYIDFNDCDLSELDSMTYLGEEYCWDCVGQEECTCYLVHDEPESRFEDDHIHPSVYFDMMMEEFEDQQPYRYHLRSRLSTIREDKPLRSHKSKRRKVSKPADKEDETHKTPSPVNLPKLQVVNLTFFEYV
jgi:hypothetical protein